jgi:CBS domain-containing protein
MFARDLMTRSVITISPDASIKDAIRQLSKFDITAMPVVDDEHRLVGMVSEADLLLGEIPDDPRAHVRPRESWLEPPPDVVGEAMTMHVVSVHEDSDASDIARLMLETGVKSLPVVNGETVVGVVSRRDLIQALATTDDRIHADIESLLHDADLPDWSASVYDGEVVLVGPGEPRDARLAKTLAGTVQGVSSVRTADA